MLSNGWDMLLTTSGHSIHVSAKGYMTGEIGVDWIKMDFDPPTCEVTKDHPRLLIVDGHASHFM